MPIYKTLLLLLNRAKGREDAIDPFLAGVVGGYVVFGQDNPINQQIILYLFSRISMGLAHLAVEKKLIVAPNGSFSAFAAITWGIVMWLHRKHQKVLQGSLRASMQFLYNDSDTFSSFDDWMFHNK